jgi:sugar phosphate isomerase/epimerase
MQLATKFKPDADAPFQTALAAGLRCAELWTGPDVLDNWQAVVERARRFDLRYALHFPNRRDLTDAHLQNFVELYRALGCRSATIHQLEFDRYGATMQQSADDVCLAVENSHLDVPGFHRWAEANRYLTFDVEHVWFLTLPESHLDAVLEFIVDFLEKHAAKIRHVHMPGYTPGMPDHRPMHTSRMFVTRALTLLRHFGYDGFVVSEVDVQYQNIDDLQKDRVLFEQCMRIFEQSGHES